MFMIKSDSCMTVASSTDAIFLSCSLAEASPIKIKKTLALSFSTYMWSKPTTHQCVVVLAAGNMDYVTMQQAVGNSKNH